MMDTHNSQKGHACVPLFQIGSPIKMGLRPAGLMPWLGGPDPLGIYGLYERQITEKNRLADTRPEDIFCLSARAEPAAQEAVGVIHAYLHTHQGRTLPAPTAEPHALFSLSRNIPEDILIMLRDEQGFWRLQGGVLAFPGHWRLSEKMGQSLAEIHAPVPEYAAQLAKPVNRFFDHMQASQISRRQNWAVQTDDQLFTPRRHAPAQLPTNAGAAGQQIHIRVETQSFYKLPQSGAVIFSIRTSLAPLDYWQSTPEQIHALATAISALPADLYAYKGLAEAHAGIIAWLDAIQPA